MFISSRPNVIIGVTMSKYLGDMIYSEDRVPPKYASKAASHTPRIDAPDRVRPGEDFTLKIVVGPHPNTVDHSIRWIDVFLYEEGREFNPIHIARILLEAGYTLPEVTLKMRIQKRSVVHAVSYCNLHGLWEARKEIDVE